MELKSERLYYREITEDDLPLIYSVYSNEKVMKYAYMDKMNSEEELMPYIKPILQQQIEPCERHYYEFGVFISSGSTREQFIGIANIEIGKRNHDGGIGEIGYFLLQTSGGVDMPRRWLGG